MSEAELPKGVLLKKTLKKYFSRKFRQRLKQAEDLKELLIRIDGKKEKLESKLFKEKDADAREMLLLQLKVLAEQREKALAMQSNLEDEEGSDAD